jgi:pantoate--beta-alanine ligase
MQRRATALRAAGARIGFVPTMGALHAGHLSLVARARPGCDVVAASIFVNPLQFGPGEDLERYPRPFERDRAELEAAGCDLLFVPPATDMYATEARTFVVVDELQDVLCGRSRPGHFRGVTTVVAKLFNLVQPHVAVFGQKDAQQAVILRRMVQDLDWPIELRVAPIVRDPDGLALSSRNAYLSREERREALLLHEALGAARARLAAGERRSAPLCAAGVQVLSRGERLRSDYFEIVEAATLAPCDPVRGRVLIAVAAWAGSTRLIDNLVLDVRDDGVSDAEL